MSEIGFAPLVKALVGAEGRFRPPIVFYKVLERQRADDVPALLAMVRELPANTEYRSVPPSREHWNHLDTRFALVPVIRRLTGTDESSRSRDQLYAELRSARDRLGPDSRRRDALDLLFEHCASWSDDIETVAAAVLDLILHPPMPRLSPEDEKQLRAPPDPDAPVLIVGRPEKLYNWDHPLKEVLVDAGYPNRFSFGDGGGLFYDRKTGIEYPYHHRRPEGDAASRGPRIRDGGFIFMGHRPSGAPLIVLAGHTARATREAAALLIQRRQLFELAARKFGKSSDACVDIGFLLLRDQARTRLVDRNLVGFLWNRAGVERVRRLLSAFSTNESGAIVGKDTLTEGEYRDLTETPSLAWVWHASASDGPDTSSSGTGGESAPGPTGTSDLEVDPGDLEVTPAPGRVQMDSDATGLHNSNGDEPAPAVVSRCPVRRSTDRGPIKVTIVGRPFRVSEQRSIFLDYTVAPVYENIRDNIEADRTGCQRQLELHWDRLQKGEGTMAFQALVPVLLMGETGAGKQLLAEYFAFGWRGVVLRYDPRSAGLTPAEANDQLWALVHQWWGSPIWCSEHGEGERMRTFWAPSVPTGLLDSELFGVGRGAANDVLPNPSAFQMAGTGVLFMDELFELAARHQARLLGTLQTGRVRPIKVSHEFPFACRVLAATNAVVNEAELAQLTETGKVRPDLVARFTTRYVVPPLRARTLELIPALMDMLNSRVVRGADCERPCQYLRISRAALEFLVSHQFKDNFRELNRLATCLDRKVADSFVWSAEQLRDRKYGDLQRALEENSIRFSDMAAMHGHGPPEWLDIDFSSERREDDYWFYEFSFADDAFDGARLPWKDYWETFEKPETPHESLSDPVLETLLEWCAENRGALGEACRQVGEVLPRYWDALHRQKPVTDDKPLGGADDGLPAPGKTSAVRPAPDQVLATLNPTANRLAIGLWRALQRDGKHRLGRDRIHEALQRLFRGYPILARRMPYNLVPSIQIMRQEPDFKNPGPTLMKYLLTGGKSDQK